jgi:hypothetical protein
MTSGYTSSCSDPSLGSIAQIGPRSTTTTRGGGAVLEQRVPSSSYKCDQIEAPHVRGGDERPHAFTPVTVSAGGKIVHEHVISCGCRHQLCCEQTSHDVGKCPRAPTRRCGVFGRNIFVQNAGLIISAEVEFEVTRRHGKSITSAPWVGFARLIFSNLVYFLGSNSSLLPSAA